MEMKTPQEPIRDIFRRDGVKVQPPQEIETLFDEVTAAVERYIKNGSACRGDCETNGLTNDVERWGGCPECHQNDGYRFYQRDIYFVCTTHRLAWKVGSNLFSAWEHMTNHAILAQLLELEFGYKRTESPWCPPKMYTLADGTQKLETELKDGETIIMDGLRQLYTVRRDTDNFGDTELSFVPVRCEACGHQREMADEIPFDEETPF